MFVDFCKKINKMCKLLKKEYEEIIELYNEDNIYKKSLPIKAGHKCNKNQKKQVDEVIDRMFKPYYSKISELIDHGFFILDGVNDPIDLKAENYNPKLIDELKDRNLEKLFIYRYIKYNMILNFILQLYLMFEKELIICIKSIEENFSEPNLFSTIRFLESNYNFKIKKQNKEKLNLYRNIINVYKHGYGESYLEIEKNNKTIINFKLKEGNDNSAFLFDINKFSFNELYDNITYFLDKLSSCK